MLKPMICKWCSGSLAEHCPDCRTCSYYDGVCEREECKDEKD